MGIESIYIKNFEASRTMRLLNCGSMQGLIRARLPTNQQAGEIMIKFGTDLHKDVVDELAFDS